MNSQYFHSNCLLEAIKAKLKNPKKVRILRIPARLNAVPCSHFMWTDGKKEYDFGKLGHISWYQYPWHTGRIRTHRLGCYDRYMAEAKTNSEIILSPENQILHTLNED